MSATNPYDEDISDSEPAMLGEDEALEEIAAEDDTAMDSGDDAGEEDADGDQAMGEEYTLNNDSVGHFDRFRDSIFCIAAHPTVPSLIAVGGSEGEDAGGIGYLFDSTPADSPVLPESYQTQPAERTERKGIEAISTLDGHTDSINAVTFTLPAGAALLTGGLDGALRVWVPSSASNPLSPWTLLTAATEVDEINWLSASPSADHPNTFALGAADGSVWVYTVDTSAPGADSLTIVQTYFAHTTPCTAGAWSADGSVLATVSEEGSLYVWAPFSDTSSQAIVSLTAADARFAVEGGLFSVAIAPSGAYVAVGGAGGAIKIVGLPKAGAAPAKGKKAGGPGGATQAGVILADLRAQSDSVESLAFAPAPSTVMAAGSVDGSIVLFDAAMRFAVKRHIKEAHAEESVVQVAFAGRDPKVLVSAGMDGVVRRWDTGGAGVGQSGLVGEWSGQAGGVLAFVGSGGRVVTAGDDGLSLVFEEGR